MLIAFAPGVGVTLWPPVNFTRVGPAWQDAEASIRSRSLQRDAVSRSISELASHFGTDQIRLRFSYEKPRKAGPQGSACRRDMFPLSSTPNTGLACFRTLFCQGHEAKVARWFFLRLAHSVVSGVRPRETLATDFYRQGPAMA